MHFDDIPSRAAEDSLEFLNDFSVAAHRSIKTLQVAVHHENQIVQILARGQGDGSQRFRFIHFAIAHERPDFAAGGLFQPAIFQIADKAGMIDRLDRSQAHRNRGKLPEIRHQPGMGIGAQSAAGLQFAAEIFQLLRWDTAFEIGAGVNSRRGVTLKINEVAIATFGLRLKEMIESNLVQSGGGSEGGDVSANAFLNFVGAHHHGQSVPAHQALDAAFHLLASGKWRLLRNWDRVLVRSSRRERKIHSRCAPRVQRQLLNQASRAHRAALGQNIIERVNPLTRFQYLLTVSFRLSHV